MKKLIILLLTAFTAASAGAKNYYFAASGDDSRTAAQAQNPATPWKSITKLNTIFATLLPGDSVLFKRGDNFFGSMKITKSGTAAAPIVISAYGTGEKPVITGFVTLNNWKEIGDGMYEATNSQLPARVNMLTLNGIPKAMGRYPNADAPNKGYLTVGTATASTLTDPLLPTAVNWTGAELVMRTTHWTLDRVKVTAHSGRTLTFGSGARYAPRPKFGYFLQNDVRTLDQPGEWAHDGMKKKITMQFGSSNPEDYVVKASVLQDLIYLYDKDYIVFDNLALEGANENAIDLYATAKSRIQNCAVRNTGVHALYLKNTDDVVIESNDINNTNSIGIYLVSGTDNTIVRGNSLRNTGIWAGMGQNSDNTDLAIRANGHGTLIEYNVIDSSGYCGIRFVGNNVIIRNNLITRFGFVKDDAGGIYTSATATAAASVGRKIQNNIIMDGYGAKEGTSASSVQQVSGIYLDNRTSGIEITGNTMVRCGKVGLYVHNAYNLVIKNNLCYDNTAQVMLNHDDSKMSLIRNVDMRDNIFISKLASQVVGQFFTKTTDINQFGTIDRNIYSRPQNETGIIQVRTFLYTSTEARKTVSLDTWKTMYGHDGSSIRSFRALPAAINPEDSVLFEYNATTQPKTIALNGVYADARKKEYSGSVTIAPFSSVVLFYADRLPVVQPAPQPGPVIITKPVDTTQQKPVVKFYIQNHTQTFSAGTSIKMSATATDRDGIRRIEFFVNGVYKKGRTSAPYEWIWTNVPAGSYRIRAKAWDKAGKYGLSDYIYITVKAAQ